jgi:hypothetical protein
VKIKSLTVDHLTIDVILDFLDHLLPPVKNEPTFVIFRTHAKVAGFED